MNVPVLVQGYPDDLDKMDVARRRDSYSTFGNRAVAKVPNLQKLMQYVCRNGFEHHVVMNASKTGAILKEAFENYMGWEVYEHL